MGRARVGTRRVLIVVSAAILGIIGAAQGPALAKKGKDPIKASRRCRGAIGTWGSKVVSAGLGDIDSCHKKRDAGKFNGACNVVGQRFGPAVARGGAVIGQACSAGDPVLDNYPDQNVKTALFPGIERVLEGSGNDVQGEPSIVGKKSSVKCHTAIGKARSGIVREVIKRSVSCQKKLDRKGTKFESIKECVATPGKSVDKGRAVIGKACGGVSGPEVGSCSGLPDCLIVEATTTGQVLARGIYGAPPSEQRLNCGDGVLDIREECDDGNKIATDACTDLCKKAVCNDGIVEAGVEECDNDVRDPKSGSLPPGSNENACTDTCKLARCGDDIVETGVEECDDGNDTPGDGCTDCKGDSAVCGSASEGLKVEIALDYPASVSSHNVQSVNVYLEYHPSQVSIPSTDQIIPLDRYMDLQVVEIPSIATDRSPDQVGTNPLDPPIDPADRLVTYLYGRLSVSMGVERGPVVDLLFDCTPADTLLPRDFKCTAIIGNESGGLPAATCRVLLKGQGTFVTTTTTSIPTTSSTTLVTTTTTTSTSTTVTTTTSTSSTTMVGATTTTTTTTTSLPPAVCGDHTVEAPETCDDGNTQDETTPGYDPLIPDFCPATCIVGTCSPSGSTTSFDVNFSASLPLGGVKVFVDYPDGKVSIPGIGNDASVTARISHVAVASGVSGIANDLDYGLIEVLGGPIGGSIPGPRFFTITFDTCTGAPPVTAADFGCVVKNASDTDGNDLSGVTCTVVPPAP